MGVQPVKFFRYIDFLCQQHQFLFDAGAVQLQLGLLKAVDQFLPVCL